MRRGMLWLVVGAVLGGSALAGQEPALSPEDREAAERTLAAMRDLGSVWMSWLTDTLTAEDFAHPEWLEPPARSIRRVWSLPDSDDPEAVRRWVERTGARMAWERNRRYRADWPGYYDLEKLPIRFAAAELEEVLRELLPAERLEGLVWEDGWGRPLELRFSGRVLAPQVMAIRSGGRDGVPGGTMYRVGAVAPDPDADIVWADGFFLRWPDGVGPRDRAGAGGL